VQPQLSDRDLAINLRVAREVAGLSQDQVSAGMSLRGYPYYRATVYKIESNVRRVPAVEIPALAAELNTTIEQLLGASTDYARAFMIEMADAAEAEAELAAREAIEQWVRASKDLGDLALEYQDDPSEDVQAALMNATYQPSQFAAALQQIIDKVEHPEDYEEED
jgi:transcriptional regulator with XRE-family HTH domain